MRDRLSNLKPGVSPRTLLFCAALLWTAIGLLLVQRGTQYLVPHGSFWLVLAAVGLGSLKSRFILDRAAKRGVERIRRFSDNTCIGAVYSWKTWLVVLAMAVFGLIVRGGSIPGYIVGIVCVAVGWALIGSSRFGWKAWFYWKPAKDER